MRAVLERDFGACRFGLPGCTRRATTAGHVVAKSAGGSDHPSNLKVSCAACSAAKRRQQSIDCHQTRCSAPVLYRAGCRVPRIADGTGVPRAQVAEAFRAIPGASVPDPDRLWTVPRVDLGTGEESGVGSFPPATGEVFPTLVSAVDSDGNEVAGIRLPDLTTPLGTHAGWNVRHPQTGGAGQIMPMVGSTLPFAATRGEREASADPRPSIEERYGGRDEYLARVRSDAARLAADRYLLTEDIEVLVADAVARWDVMVPVTAR